MSLQGYAFSCELLPFDLSHVHVKQRVSLFWYWGMYYKKRIVDFHSLWLPTVDFILAIFLNLFHCIDNPVFLSNVDITLCSCWVYFSTVLYKNSIFFFSKRLLHFNLNSFKESWLSRCDVWKSYSCNACCLHFCYFYHLLSDSLLFAFD